MPLSNAELIDRSQAGFQALSLDADIKRSAVAHLEDWLDHDKFASLLDGESSDYRPLLEWMITGEEFNLVLDSFYQVMPFGTGGRRGPVGIGPNRINPYTIASSVQGHVEYLRRRFPEESDLKVIVAYDVRRYSDLRQHYPADVPNPVLGLSSKDFAHIAASVYCAAGAVVYMLPDELDDYLSTPELSFLIRRFEAHGGLNVSASHNHPDDNGGKFYNSRGGQEIPPHDEEMVKIVETITDVKSMPYEKALESGLIRPITDAHRQAYVDLNLSLRLRTEPGGAKIVYTPLHGTGRNTVGRCLQAAGFEEGKQLFTVEAQRPYRGDFANVKFRIPNPEVPESLDLAIELGKEVGADLVLATDPDADRIGGAMPVGDGFVFLNGNEFATIVTRYRLESLGRQGKLPASPFVVTTRVTTDLVSRIAESHGALIVDNLLVGFKYVADVLDHLERKSQFGDDLKATPDDLVVAAEESNGLLVTPDIRDKDAAGAAVVLAELIAELRESGRSLHDYLVETYKLYGYHSTLLRSTVMLGARGMARIDKIQRTLRKKPWRSIGGIRVNSITDYWDKETFGRFKSETDKVARNLLVFELEGGMRCQIRPSGTEPKNKVYIEKRTEPVGPDASDEIFFETKKAVDHEVEEFSHIFMKDMLRIIGVDLPDFSLEISDLVDLDNKRHFAETFLPGFEEQAGRVMAGEETPQAVSAWADEQLRNYGPDARDLVSRAFTSYLALERRRKPESSALHSMMEEIFAEPKTNSPN